MVKLHQVELLDGFSQNADDSSVLSIILLSASMLSFVITLVGVKWWFRHRLSLERVPSQVESPVLLRTTSATEIRENCARGVYRQSIDADSLIQSERPSMQNGKTKAKTNDRQSIFRFPFKSKLKLSMFSSHEDKQVSTSQATTSVHPPNREQDVATIHKNENLKRMIHDKLNPRSSAKSMPDLSLSPTLYSERSVDDPRFVPAVLEESEPTHVDFINEVIPRIQITNGSHHEPQENIPEINNNNVDDKHVREEEIEIVQKRVKFEDVNEIVKVEFYEAQFEGQVENEYGEMIPVIRSTESSSYQNDIPLLPPTPMKRKSRENSFEMPRPTLPRVAETASIEENQDAPPAIKPRTKRLLHRTSSASSYGDDIVAQREEKSLPKLIITNNAHNATNEPTKSSPTDCAEQFNEINQSLPDVKEEDIFAKVKKRPSKIATDETIVDTDSSSEFSRSSNQETFSVNVIEVYKEVVAKDDVIEVREKFEEDLNIRQTRESNSSSRPQSIEVISVEHNQAQPIEIQVIPKSILKSSEASFVPNSPKTITFQAEPQRIFTSDVESSSSDDEEDDIWNAVNRHRYQLNRYKSKDVSDVPPPLPKTPPPSVDEEKEFSFA